MNFCKLSLPLFLIFLFSVSTLTAAETAVKTATDTITTEKVTAVKKALPIDMMCEEIAGVENLPDGYIGADVCVACHEDKLQTMLHTSHGQSSDPRAPFGQRDCETCHGAGMEHIESEDRQCVVSLKGTYGEVIAERNDVCLSCHKGDDITHWFSSRHEAEDMACVNCHTIHEPNAELSVVLRQKFVIDVIRTYGRKLFAPLLIPYEKARSFAVTVMNPIAQQNNFH